MVKQDSAEFEDFKNLVGDRLRELREARGMSREELADASGISRTAVYDYECGNKAISLWVAVKIIRVLKASSVAVLTK